MYSLACRSASGADAMDRSLRGARAQVIPKTVDDQLREPGVPVPLVQLLLREEGAETVRDLERGLQGWNDVVRPDLAPRRGDEPTRVAIGIFRHRRPKLPV